MPKQTKTEICNLDIHDIEYLVCHIALLWRRLLGIKIKSLGINITEKRILFCIARNPGLTQIEVAKLLDLEPQNLMRSLDKMEKLGWIVKKQDPKDRRVKCLSVTPQAKKIISQINTLGDKLKPRILSGMDAKKTQLIVDQLSEIRENLLGFLEEVELS
jgi:MarR family transcriptional regulator for hemolysin